MVKQHEFESYDAYLASQLKLTRKKLKIFKFHRCFTSNKVVDAIHKHHKTKVEYGVCHGVRKGQEVDMFQEKFLGKWIGTEIVPEICDEKKILNRDFNQIYQEWIGHFDIIYSNSYDHSNDPLDTIKIWLSCLSETGRVYIEWTIWHNKLGKGTNKGDCFAASKREYQDIFEQAGTVEDILTIPDISTKNNFRFSRHIFVIH